MTLHHAESGPQMQRPSFFLRDDLSFQKRPERRPYGGLTPPGMGTRAPLRIQSSPEES